MATMAEEFWLTAHDHMQPQGTLHVKITNYQQNIWAQAIFIIIWWCFPCTILQMIGLQTENPD